MFTVEFQTTVANGTIEIPEPYRSHLQGVVKVIVLAEENRRASDKIAQLLATPLELSDFEPLTRDQAHERC